MARLPPVRCWARRPSGRSARAQPTPCSLASRTTLARTSTTTLVRPRSTRLGPLRSCHKEHRTFQTTKGPAQAGPFFSCQFQLHSFCHCPRTHGCASIRWEAMSPRTAPLWVQIASCPQRAGLLQRGYALRAALPGLVRQSPEGSTRMLTNLVLTILTKTGNPRESVARG